MERTKYKCCFCGKEIESNKLDVTSLIVTINWDKEVGFQEEQQFFCHIMCFKSRLYDGIPLYLFDFS